jgi:hypothetical protein
MFSSKDKANPLGLASLESMIGLSILTPKSIAKTLPVGDSIEVSPSGPLSVKNKQLFFSERIIEFGPFSGLPSKSLITGVISILWSVTV